MATKVWTTQEGSVGTSFDVRVEDGETVQVFNADPATLIENVAFPTFVFSPSNPAPAGNVYNDWATLQTAYAKVAGPKWIEFDPTFAAITIPAGAWSLEDCTCSASKATSTGQVIVTWASGATFTSAHLTLKSIVFICSNTINNPGASGHTIYVLDDASVIQGSAGQTGVPLVVSGTCQLFLNNGSSLGDSASHSPVVSVAGTGIFAGAFFSASVALDHWLTGVNTANAVVAADATCTVSNVTDGAMVPLFELFVNGNTFTFRPGGTLAPGQGVYTTWAGVMAAYALTGGPIGTIYVDDSIAAAHMTAAATPWALGQCVLAGNFNSATETLIIDDGASFTFERLTIRNTLTVKSNALTVPFVLAANGFAVVYVEEGSIVLSTVAHAIFQNSGGAGGELLFEIEGGAAVVGDGTHPVVTTDAGSSTFFNVVGANVSGAFASVRAHALAGAGSTTLSALTSYCHFDSTTQDVTTLVVQLSNGFNEAHAAGNTGTGTGSVTVTTGNVTRNRAGKFLIIASITGSIAASAAVTAQLKRDATNIGNAVSCTPLSAADVFSMTPMFIDTAPDGAPHTYQLAVTAAQNLTVAATSAQIQVIEL